MSEKIPTWTPEQLKEEEERTKSDAELINRGSEYVIDGESKNPRLDVTQRKKDEAHDEMNSEFEKRKIIEEIKSLEAEVGKEIATYEGQFLTPEKIRLREELLREFKYYPVNNDNDYHYHIKRLCKGEYYIERVDVDEEKFNRRFEDMADKGLASDDMERFNEFINKNEDIEFFDGYERDCIHVEREKIISTLKRIEEDDDSKEIVVILPCDSGYTCSNGVNELLPENSRVKFHGPMEKNIPNFSKKIFEATGKKLIRERVYPANLYLDSHLGGFKLNYPDDIQKKMDKIKELKRKIG